MAVASKFPSEPPLKRSAGVEFEVSEEEETLWETVESAKSREKSNDGDSIKMATSTGGLTTEIGLPETDDMVGQGPSTSYFIVPLFGGNFVGCELRPREELVGVAKVCQRSKYYSSQSAKTLLKDFFELTPPKVSDSRHTALSLSANQINQFARTIGLEVTLAPYGLLADLLVH